MLSDFAGPLSGVLSSGGPKGNRNLQEFREGTHYLCRLSDLKRIYFYNRRPAFGFYR